MRKFIALAIAFCLSLSLMACGGGEDTTKAPDETKAPELLTTSTKVLAMP